MNAYLTVGDSSLASIDYYGQVFMIVSLFSSRTIVDV